MDYRHELKHRVNMADYALLRNRLKHLMAPDPHGDENGTYTVRSLYFDNLRDKALQEKLDGVDRREKFRLRCYNGDEGFIRLEKKTKCKGLSSKYSARLSRAEAEAIIACDWERIRRIETPLVRELYAKMQSEQLRPRTLVQYQREAYLYPAGNVRVTFDTALKTGLFSTGLLDPNTPLVTPGEPVALLEVKYDEFIPEHLVRLLQLGDRRAGAFSKYAACRVYG
ncbi:MAG: polyphosphate polymerase domain-containing protein [Bacillota bacterium]